MTSTTSTSTSAALATTVDTWLRAYTEPDAAVRTTLIAQVWAPDGELVDPPVAASGADGIHAVAGALQDHFPGHTFRRTSAVDAHHDVARYTWEMIGPDGTAALAGTDVVTVAADGRLTRVAGFFGEPAPA